MRILAAATALFVAGRALAAGTATDYTRSSELELLTRGKVAHAVVEPHWLDHDAFWFRRDLGNHQTEALFIDSDTGTRRAATAEETRAAAPPATPPSIWHDSFADDAPGDPASPDGHWQVIPKDGNLLLLNTATHEESTVTTDAAPNDHYDPREVWWSPDSHHLLAMKTQDAQQHKVYMVDSSPRDQVQPRLKTIDYLKPGDRIAVPKLRLFSIPDAKPIPISDTLFPTPWSIEQIRWDADSKRFTFLYNQRGHQVLRFLAIDAATGQPHTLIEETSPTFIDYADKMYLRLLPATHEALWMSERDGWNHLYLIDTDTGTLKNQITRGPWVVRGVEHVDVAKRQIWFEAAGIYPEQDPYYIHECRIDFDGSHLVKLTSADATHSVTFSPDRRYFLDKYSRVDLPPVTKLHRAEDGSLVCDVEAADWSKLLALGWATPERFAAKGRDGTTDIYGVIYRPMHVEPGAHLPVIEDIYAGPQGFFVRKDFSRFDEKQRLAELGFIVVQIDGMGTNWRSRAFHDVCWHNLGDAGFPDRILWLKAAAAKYPEMDLSRVGIYGVSAGAQSALRALEAYGDFYKAAVADCGCHDNRMDKIWWNELWMGWPVGPWYREQSNVVNAHNMRGKLLLMVGELDTNVDPASTMQVANALINANKDFDLLVIPGKNHGAGEAPYGLHKQYDFFVRNLLGVEPPPW